MCPIESPHRRRPRSPAAGGRVAVGIVVVLVVALGTVACRSPRAESASGRREGMGIAGRVAAPTTTVPPSTSPPAQTLAWRPCGGELSCAGVAVPVDYATAQDGATVVLALAKLPATGAARRGTLLVNPGGPGASGVQFLRDGAALFATLRRSFDIVAWDPRGTGTSNPIRCSPGLDAFYGADPSPDTPDEKQRLIELSKQFAADCAARNPSLFAHVGTADVVRDMDVIRAALGEDKLTYLGFSYGTLLGARYAAAYPQRVRAMVLDGAVDPGLDPMEATRQQALGFERALDAFLADCAGRTACPFHSGGNPAAAFDALAAAVDASPVPGPNGRMLGPGEFGWAIASALYDKSAGWPALARGLAAARNGDGAGLLELGDVYLERRPDGSYANTLEALAAVQCDDDPYPSDIATWDAFADRLAAEAPRMGRMSAYGGLVCAYWPQRPAPSPKRLDAAGVAPILVVGATGDPATPYEWAQRLAHALPGAVLLTREGEGHTSYGESACIDSAVNRYLVDLALPEPGKRCK